MGESLTEQYRVEEKEDLWVDLYKSIRALQPTEQNVDEDQRQLFNYLLD